VGGSQHAADNEDDEQDERDKQDEEQDEEQGKAGRGAGRAGRGCWISHVCPHHSYHDIGPDVQARQATTSHHRRWCDNCDTTETPVVHMAHVPPVF
jgi:hypothetical protein